MLRSRVIPCLLIRNKGLVKTVKFNEYKYVGDPINAVKIFNEKQVDELIVLDIDATVDNREPDYQMIENLAKECRMPLCYGGGIKNVEQAKKIIKLGVEKIALSSSIMTDFALLKNISNTIGMQSTVVVLDIKKTIFMGKYQAYTHNGRKKVKQNLMDLVRKIENIGIGEFVINSIDRDGMMEGYDYLLIDKIREQVNTPMTVLGGAGSVEDIRALIKRYGLIGAGVGSLFVFKGKYKAVLINYSR